MSLVDQFELDQKRRNLSPETINLRKRQFRLIQEDGGIDLKTATAEQIENWLDLRVKPDGSPISAKTRSCYLTTFSAFYKWAIKHDILKTNPIEKIDRPKVHNGMPNPIPERDLKRAIEQCTNPMLKCWIVIEAYAGLRCKEVAYLAQEDIQVDIRYDREGNVTSLGRIHVRFGKGGKERFVPLHQKILDVLAEYDAPSETGRLWPYQKPSSVSQRINRFYHGKMGIKHTAHKNRHRAGTQIHRTSGGDILAVQAFLGHADPKTSAIYAQVDNEVLNTAVSLIA